MKAKLVKDVLNENNELDETIHWPTISMSLYYIYRFIKNHLSNYKVSMDSNDIEIIEGLLSDLKIVIDKKRHVKYEENSEYHIFEYNVYSHIANKEHHVSIIKINKDDRTLSYTIGTGKYAEFENFPVALSKKQYSDFLYVLND